MAKFFQGLVLIVALAILGMVGYTSYNYIKEKNSLKFTPIVIDMATSTPSSTVVSFATSTVDTSKWKIYKNEELGYGVKYPDDLIINYDASKLFIVFPQKNYFHWPLLDDVKLTIIATSTCQSSGSTNASTSEITLNDRLYTLESDASDAAMGTRWNETIYSIKGNGICYKIFVNSRGTNGAGFYVDDSSLVKKYDNQHSIDNSTVKAIIWGILGSFEIIKIPAGDIES